MIRRISLTCLAFALVSVSAVLPLHAQIQVSATVDRTTLAAGESLQLTISIQGGEGEVDTTAITDFQVAPQGSSTSLQFINGRSSRQTAYSFILMPIDQAKQQWTIPALKVTVDERAYTTKPIHIRVDAQGASGTNDSDQPVWVTATVSETAPFAGQQLIYTFSFYNTVQVTEARFQPPDFKGFMAKEVEKRRSGRQTINGREVAVAQIDYVLVPTAGGTLTIDPAVLQVGIVRQEGRRQRSPFDDFFDPPFLNRGTATTKMVKSRPLTVEVQPLPPYSGKAPFSGLVGRFALTAGVEKSQLQVGDSTTLAMTIQGQGNIMDAQAPELPIPQGFKTYADTPQEQVTLEATGYQGQKVFRIALVPVKPGSFELPPVTLTYFDVAQKAYRTLSAPLPVVQVQPAAPDQAAPLLVTPQGSEPEKQRVEFTGRDILPLKEGMEALRPFRPLAWWVFVMGIIVPAIALAGLIGVQRVRRPDPSPAARMKTKARKALKAAQAVSEDPPAFLPHLYQALTAAIFSSAGRTGEALTWKEAEALLGQSGQDPQIARQAAQALSDIESAGFSGAAIGPDQGRRLFEQAQDLVRRLAP